MKKLKGNITATIIILFVSLLAFCACGIDTSYVVVSRYKLQKVTETMALVMASKLKAQEAGHRSKEELNLTAYNFETLYSKPESGFWSFDVKNIDFKEDNNNVRVKVFVNAEIPTYYLRFVGIGKITLSAVSYAKGEDREYQAADFDITNSTTITFENDITDKTGDDIEIKYNDDYFAFVGLGNGDNSIVWSDLGNKTDAATVDMEIGSGLSAQCISKDASYDLNKKQGDEIGIVKYLKIYKADCTGKNVANDLTPEAGNAPPLIKILNNVSLINRSEF